MGKSRGIHEIEVDFSSLSEVCGVLQHNVNWHVLDYSLEHSLRDTSANLIRNTALEIQPVTDEEVRNGSDL